MNAEEEFLSELSELTYWAHTVGRQTAAQRTNVYAVGRVFGIDFWHLDPIQDQCTALVAATVPWLGHEEAVKLLRHILTEDRAGRWEGVEIWRFRKFWEGIDYWPGMVSSVEDRIQYGTTVRGDDRAAADYQSAWLLSGKFSERFLFAALRNPGMLSENHSKLAGLPEEYAAEALGLNL